MLGTGMRDSRELDGRTLAVSSHHVAPHIAQATGSQPGIKGTTRDRDATRTATHSTNGNVVSINVMNWVWENSKTSGTELLMLLAIADSADHSGGNAYPSRRTLAAKTRLDPSTVRRVIGRLRDGGHLKVQAGGGRANTNMYTVVMADTSPTTESPVDNLVDNLAETGADRPRGELPQGRRAPQREAERPTKGGTVPPNPSTPVLEPSTAVPGAPDRIADSVLTKLGRRWFLNEHQRLLLAPQIHNAIIQGWTIKALISALSANPDGVVSPFAVLTSRLKDLPPPDRATQPPIPRPDWCGHCDQITRQVERDDGRIERCQHCHPLRNTSPYSTDT